MTYTRSKSENLWILMTFKISEIKRIKEIRNKNKVKSENWKGLGWYGLNYNYSYPRMHKLEV